jgi:hypothetical protein
MKATRFFQDVGNRIIRVFAILIGMLVLVNDIDASLGQADPSTTIIESIDGDDSTSDTLGDDFGREVRSSGVATICRRDSRNRSGKKTSWKGGAVTLLGWPDDDDENDALDVLSIGEVSIAPDGAVTVKWHSKPDKVFQLEGAANLVRPVWTSLGEWVRATDNTVSLSADTSQGGYRFFRIVLID